MSGAQWAVPIVLGLVAAGLTYVAAPDEVQIRLGTDADVRMDGPYVLVPTVEHDASLLRYGAPAPSHGLGGILDIHHGRVADGMFWWDGHGWECHRTGAACGPPDPVPVALGRAQQGNTTDDARTDGEDAAADSEDASADADDAASADAGAGAGGSNVHNGSGGGDAQDAKGDVAGHGRPAPVAVVSRTNATVDLTFYLFTSSGHLLATNAPRSAWAHFDLHGQFTRSSSTVWHLGEGEPPAGARGLPMFREEVFALLDGTPVGGVRSVVLEEHPYDWLLGPVWATARVEAVVGAR